MAVRLPVICKDFLFEPYQVYQARAWGADAILIIMAAVTDDEAKALEETANALEMSVLVEVHDEAEMERALQLTSRLVGINNRDLRTFEVDLATSERLVRMIPDTHLAVSESGIFTHADCLRLQKSGISCFLVGESLMRQDDVTLAVRHLMGEAAAEAGT
jgi:indole-3-glycerol phosphate synthase